jgi:UDP-4-amino-4,6-dideoxy-N-acetyl-beta-L-altrosamine transaminase
MNLAILGGQPVKESFLTYGKQSIDERDIEAVVEVLRGDYLTTGPYVRNFEARVAEYVGAKYAVAVSNGTTALHAAMFGCEIEKGDEVIVTPMTFAASANAILYCEAIPVFADIDKRTYNIDVQDIERKITEKTRAIVPVHFAGQPVDLDEILELAQKYGLRVIEDGAHALGSEYRNKKIGTFGDATTFSLHPVKPITTGEGGIITTNDEKIYQRMMQFRTHGITRDIDLLKDTTNGSWYYEQQELGYNYRLTDIQAALGISQLEKIDDFINRRRDIASIYDEAFKELQGIITPCEKADRKSGYHLYVIRLDFNFVKGTRKQIFEALIAENIGVNVHYIPVYYHPYYESLGYRRGICAIAEEVYEGIITLPIFPKMSSEDIESVILAVDKVITYYRR